MPVRPGGAALLTCILAGMAACPAGDASQAVSFNRDVRPILNAKCMACHGGVKQAGNLSVQHRADILGKGKSGELCVVPGKPESSELIRRIMTADEDDRMPKDKPALDAAQIDILTRWVAQGAKWEEHWSFVAPVTSPAPAVRTTAWPRNDIDRFILSRLESEGLAPAKEADRATLLRRVTLDLTGLPPTAETTTAFLADEADDAYERAVDRLLASPRFGERWAAMWMDLSRYGDTKSLGHDGTRDIWPYRDWIIAAFNQDMRWDDFVIRQMAGDLLPATEKDLVATGFHRLTKNNDEGGTIDEEYRTYAIIDRVNTTWAAFMGLQMGCAQCHGHAYDPIRHAEYYGSYAFLNQCEDDDKDDDRPTIKIPAKPLEAERLRKLIAEAEQQGKTDATAALRKQLAALPVADFPVLRELPDGKRRETRVLVRGGWNSPGERIAEPFTPAILPPMSQDLPRDRLGLARWIASPDNPLTARVAVNHLWRELMGTGLVATAEDFGTQGERPSHPELLDTLAHRFSHEWNWSTKRVVREIVLSATYRQSSAATNALTQRDPANRLLARGPRKRLTGEMVRDQALALGGLLKLEPAGGPPYVPPSPGGYLRNAFRGAPEVTVDTGPGRLRRSVYAYWKRLEPFATLTIFDASDRDNCTARRINTNSPLQALTSMNEDVLVEAQQAMGRRLAAFAGTDTERIRHGFAQIGESRPSPSELAAVNRLLGEARARYRAEPALAQAAKLTGEEAAWWQVATVLLNTDAALNRN